MQTAGPYRLQHPLSVCDVGDVWSGVDDQGRSVTVAVLNERASADDRWRDAFAAAAEALGAAGADQLPITNSDHDTARPWVACAVEHGPGAAQIFMVLGRQLEHVQSTADRSGFRPADESHPDLIQPADPRPDYAWATQDHADVAPPAEPRPANGNPWELPPSSSRPADRPHPGYDNHTQLVPLPRQQSPDPEPATVPTRPDQTYPTEQAYTEQAGPHFPAVSAPEPHQAATPQPYSPQDQATTSYPSYTVPTSPAYDDSPAPAPRSDAGSSMPVSADRFSPFPVSGGPESWQRSRVFGDQPPPKPKRNLLLLAGVALAALLIGAGGAIAVTAARDGGDDPASQPTQAAPLIPEQLLLAAGAPTAPGVEPPQGGGWPSSWPVFTSSESTKPINSLEGLGFDFRVPPGWNCTKQDQAAAAVRYRCGEGAGASGGDLVVRTCEPICGEAKRSQLRQKEEAWGLRWTRSGPFTTWAETTEIDGKRLYGLVYIAFWRSTPEGQIDRQLVLRMTTPLATSDDLKKVANSIRDRTFTL